MTFFYIPWLELAILTTLIGALCVSRISEPAHAYRCGIAFSGSAFLCSVLAWLKFYWHVPYNPVDTWSLQQFFLGRRYLTLDELNAPLVPAVALLHFLTGLATARTKMRRFSFSWSLAAESLRLAGFSCKDPSLLIAFLALGTVPPLVELINRGRPIRVYVLHMAVFVTLLVTGWMAVQAGEHGVLNGWATVPLMAAVLIRCGTVPAHCWVTDWFEHASLGNAMLFVIPLAGVYAAVRLVVPIAPDWVLHSIGIISVVTAVYAAGMAVVQREVRRFFAFLIISQGSLVLIGLELHTPAALTGALCLWFSALLSLGGFGLTIRALEARFGRMTLVEYHGLYDRIPGLAVCFLLTGLAAVGFPFTLGFVSAELLVDGAITANLYVGVAAIVAAAFNGVAVIRAYLLLFTGARHVSSVPLQITRRERIAVLTLAALIIGGGLFPQPGVKSRYLAAEQVRQSRATNTSDK